MDSLFEAIDAAITVAEKGFDPDELAFHALTSKVELPFRDRLAYALSKAAVAGGGRIAREYKRADIAWLAGKSPKAIVELKACYTRDLIVQPEVYIRYVKSDLRKAAQCGGKGCECFAVLLATHPHGSVTPDLYDTIKYAGKINAVIKQHGDAATVRKNAEANVQSLLSDARFKSYCWPLGSYVGIQIDLLGWLIEIR